MTKEEIVYYNCVGCGVLVASVNVDEFTAGKNTSGYYGPCTECGTKTRVMKYELTFNLTMSRWSMLKVGVSCLWYSLLGTGYIHFEKVSGDNLVSKLKECE